MTMIDPLLRTYGWRIREDDGSETGATWREAQNTNTTHTLTGNSQFRVRFGIEEYNGGTIPSATAYLGYRINGGAWARVSTTTSPVRAHVSSFVTDGDPTTEQLTGGAGTWAAVGFIQNGWNLSGLADLDVNVYSEWESTLEILGGLLSTNDTVEVAYMYDVNPDSPFEGDTVNAPFCAATWPTFTKGTGALTINANSVADAASVGSPQVQNLLSIVQADSVADAASVPSPQVSPGQVQISADSVADSAAVGTPQVKPILMVYPGSVADTANVSDPAVSPGTATISADSVADAANVSDPQVVPGAVVISADSVPDSAAVSSPQVIPPPTQVQADSVADAAAVGTPSVVDLGGGPNITSVSLDDVLYRSETNWVIAGSGFGATQGGSKVFLNTANDKDGNEVEQTIQSWSDTSITVSNVTTGSLGAFAPAYVLVEIA